MGRLPDMGLGGVFRRLWAASTISGLGDGVTFIAAPLVAASLTHDPILVAGLMVAEQLPWTLLALPGGAVVDRMDRRMLMSIASAARVVGFGVLGLAIATGNAGLPLLYAISFLVGCAGMLFDNASTTVVPAVVDADQLERANGRLLATKTLAMSLLAPPAAGWLFGVAAWTPFLLDAVAFVVVAWLILTLPRGVGRVPSDGSRTSLRAAVVEGVRWLAGHRLLRTIAVTIGVENVTLGAVQAVLVLIAQQRLGLGSVGYGLLLAASAVGGITGGLLASRVVAAIGHGTVLRIGLVVEALCHLGLALTRNAVVVGLILAVLGLHLMIFSTIGASLRQSLVPPELLGRVHGAYRLVSNGGLLLGAALGGILARTFGLAAPFWFGAAGVAVLTVCAWRVLSNDHIQAARTAVAPRCPNDRRWVWLSWRDGC